MSDYAHVFIVTVAAALAIAIGLGIVVGLYAVAVVQPWALFVAVPVAAVLIGSVIAGLAWVADL